MKKIVFKTVIDWDKHAKMNGPARTAWQEVVWREHGGPAQAILMLGEDATLENILEYLEKCDRQEYPENSHYFIMGELVRDREIVSLMIEAGLICSVEVEQ